MIKYVAALVGIGILGTSLLGCYFLFNKYDAERDKVKDLEIQAATLQTTLDYERKQQAQNDQKIAEYKQSLDEIAAQRDSFRRQAQEAMKKDAKFKSWADTEIPDFVRNSLGHKPSNGVRSEGNAGNPGNR